jgi:hypothetical protein
MSNSDRPQMVNKRLIQCAICMMVFAACMSVSALDQSIYKRVAASLFMFCDGVAMVWFMVLLMKALRS